MIRVLFHQPCIHNNHSNLSTNFTSVDIETLLNPVDLVVDVLKAQSLANQVNGSSDTTDLRFVLKKTGKVGSVQTKPSHRQSGRIAPAPTSQQSLAKDTQSQISQSKVNNDESLLSSQRLQGSGETKLNDLARNVMNKLDVALTNLERDRVETASGRLKNSPLLRNSTFPHYQNQNQQRRPLSTTGSESKIMRESPKIYPNGNSKTVEELLKKPQPIEKLTKISDFSPSLSFSPSPLSLTSSPLSESSLSDIFDLQEMMFLVNNGISYLESKEQSHSEDSNTTKLKPDIGAENKPIQHKINEMSPKNNQMKESEPGVKYSKLDELEKVRRCDV